VMTSEDEILSEIFTKEVLERLRQVPNPLERLRFRLAVLAGNEDVSEHHHASLLRKRATWAHYLAMACPCGLLDRDLKSRLRSPDYEQFRGAMAECHACCVLSESFGFTFEPRPTGRSGRKVLELRGRHDKHIINFEVKSPYEPLPDRPVWAGDDSALIASVLEEASKQFSKGELCQSLGPISRLIGVS
ncbi:MAG: hypothetical protein ACRD1T_12365, partial [Acidimicrobiia bacterium]